MSRSPLAYPLIRGIDGDSGGAADLQTDIMRFMAILALCLVAIFALVQSIPLSPTTTAKVATDISIDALPQSDLPPPAVVTNVEPPSTQSPAVETPLPAVKDVELSRPTVAAVTPERQVTLARPKWVPKIQPRRTPAPVDDETIIDETIAAESPPPVAAAVAPPPSPSPPQPVQDEIGFTLRFESDLALTRLVASGQVGFYAIDAERAQRMAVNDSRISFWDASTPNSFHEMEAKTVPRPVVEALSRTGADAGTVDWGVTLPNRLQSQLNTLMREHTGGALVIGGDGNLNLEAS